MHTHFDSLYLKNGNYKVFLDLKSPLTNAEKWKILELMSTAYTLKQTAELFGRGGSNFTKNPLAGLIRDKGITNKINTVILPTIFEAVRSILEE